MAVLFFVYGLAFYGAGLLLAFQARLESSVSPRSALVCRAAFATTHGPFWWEVHDRDAPELVPSAETQATFDRGSRVGEVACTHVPGGLVELTKELRRLSA
jgi:hypothetical protein